MRVKFTSHFTSLKKGYEALLQENEGIFFKGLKPKERMDTRTQANNMKMAVWGDEESWGLGHLSLNH